MSKTCKEHPSHKDELTRLNRISGQIEGIKKMIEEQRYCVDVMTQLKAVQSAVRSVECNILERHLHSCVQSSLTSNDAKESKKKIDELLALMKKA